jgi:hypothetical protein
MATGFAAAAAAAAAARFDPGLVMGVSVMLVEVSMPLCVYVIYI